VHTDIGSFSFRGLQTEVGATSPSHAFLISNPGDAPLPQLEVAAHGDFVVTANSCVAPLSAKATGQNQCSVSVAFRPMQSGIRTGDLTIEASGVQPEVISLDAGAPVNFPTVQQGGTRVQWVELPTGITSVTASVVGPFYIALRTSYVYGSIDGVHFEPSASTDGTCGSTHGAACRVYLGIEQLPSAPLGQTRGSVLLSNGLSYALVANVLAPGLGLSPAMIDAGSIPVGSTSDNDAFTITNDGRLPITLGQAHATGPFKIIDGCGRSLAAGASCTVGVYFSPLATGAASGEILIPTSAGSIAVAGGGTGLDNPADVRINPATVNFPLPSTWVSHRRTIVVTNLSAVNSVQIGALAGLCANQFSQACPMQVADYCATLAPKTHCVIELRYVGYPGLAAQPSSVQLPVTPSSGSTAYEYAIPLTPVNPNPATPNLLSVSPAGLQFPAIPFARHSGGQIVTVKNVSTLTLSLSAASIPDFIIEPSCGPLLPSKSCQLIVHYVPISGNTQARGQLSITGVDLAGDGAPVALATLAVSGSSTSMASLGSPSYPPLIEPIPSNVDGSVTITNASATPLVLSSITAEYPSAPYSLDCPQPLAPGASCPIYPGLSSCQTSGTYCHFFIYSNAPSSPDEYVASLPQRAPVEDFQTAFEVGPPILVFPPTALGASSTSGIGVSLFNPSVQDSIAFSIAPNVNDNFTVVNQCPPYIDAQMGYQGSWSASCTVGVTFTPKTVGFHTGTVSYTSGVSRGTIQLVGFVALPKALSVSPSALSFSTPLGQTGMQTVTLKNTSTAALKLFPAVLVGVAQSSFSVSQATCGSSLAAGATCTLTVAYVPNPIDSATAALLITSGTNNDVHTVALKGVAAH
jgi:hypothetical protein